MKRTFWSMRILRRAARPRPRHRDHLRDLLAALRAAHPRRELRQRHRSPGDPRERFRLDVPGRAAGTRDAHEEIAEAIVQPLDAFSDRRDLANGGEDNVLT
jgi:hypothetical protein